MTSRKKLPKKKISSKILSKISQKKLKSQVGITSRKKLPCVCVCVYDMIDMIGLYWEGWGKAGGVICMYVLKIIFIFSKISPKNFKSQVGMTSFLKNFTKSNPHSQDCEINY